MKKSLKHIPIGIIGAIIVVLTLSMFLLLSFEKTNISWWALSFVLLAEIILFFGLICLVNHDMYLNKVFIRSGITSVLLSTFMTQRRMEVAESKRGGF